MQMGVGLGVFLSEAVQRGRAVAVTGMLTVLAAACGTEYARCRSDAQCPGEARCDLATQLCVSIVPPEPVSKDCGPATCPDGCCYSGVCLPPSAAACGTAGATCTACDANRADACAANGACACGSGPVCEAGLRCVDGGCTPTGCTAATCPNGCCSGETCLPLSVSACGTAGGSCAACDPNRADRCTASGACGCGAGAACGNGFQCVNAACVPNGCNAVTCPSGCCSGSTCLAPSLAACGAGGGACSACNPNLADTCAASGACRCGNAAACGAGSQCVGSACVPLGCTAANCPGGCCANGQCQPRSLSACGSAGSTCVACDAARADNCAATGTCRCGGGPACSATMLCNNGSCVNAPCSAATCPNGCCSNNVCQLQSKGKCGTAGGVCTNCDKAGDACGANGLCTCGGGAACTGGKECKGGLCKQ